MTEEKDLLGQALWDYVNGRGRDMITWTSLTPPEVLRTAYLFRDYRRMPAHEQMALRLSRGRILDVGAGSGSHSLWLQGQGRDAYPLDISRLACRTMERRGIRHRLMADFFRMETARGFDTILMLMNGAGLVGRYADASRLFLAWKRLLAPGGQVLVHTSDIAYVYAAFDKTFPAGKYYGEVKFFLKYGEDCTRFPWIYWAPGDLRALAGDFGFRSQILTETADGDALIRFSPI